MGQIQGEKISQAFTFAASASLSSEINLSGFNLHAIQCPSALTNTTFTFLGCDVKGGTYQSIYDDAGTEVSVTVGTSRCVSLTNVALALAPYQWIKVRGGTAATPVVEAAARTLGMLSKA